MKETNYWNEFKISGKVNDYLKYKNMESNKDIEQTSMEYGVSTNARVCGSDRNHIENSAYR